ncbi:oxygenase MpaB family protein [Microbacterium sp. GXF7504]
MTRDWVRRPAGTPAPRPAHVPSEHAVDDGVFGPDSLTWRLHAGRSLLLAVVAGTATQLLHPVLVRADEHEATAPGHRARATYRHVLTVTYGDTAAAKHAGRSQRRIHQSAAAADAVAGAVGGADAEEALRWAHNALTCIALRAFRRYGPALRRGDPDRYVREQALAAELVGIDRMLLPASAAELDDYMTQTTGRLAVTAATVRAHAALRRSAPTGRLLTAAAEGLMLPAHRRLLGRPGTPAGDRTVRAAARMLLARPGITARD